MEVDKPKDPEESPKEYWHLYFDGASKIKSSGAGLVLKSPEGFIVEYAIKLDFPTTNNEAEYEALIAGFGLEKALRAKNLKVMGDSKLVISQVTGEYEAKDEVMIKYLNIVKGQMTQFEECTVKHIPREENTNADALSQFASSETGSCEGSIYFQVLKTPSIEAKLIAPIDVGSCWMDPIKAHLKTGWVPTNVMEARKLSSRGLKYVLIDGVLYKKSFVIPFLKCLNPREADAALKEVHEGICGQHLGGRALGHKIVRLGFYWPEIDERLYELCEKVRQMSKVCPNC